MSLVEITTVSKQTELTPGFFLLELEAPQIAAVAKPGQFVHIKCSSDLSVDPLLRRPISLHWIDREKGALTLLYHVIGRGTELMARLEEGDKVDLMGPLGRGFSVAAGAGQNPRQALVIGGGIGAAPLLPVIDGLVKEGCEVTYMVGARTRANLFGLKEASNLGAVTIPVTDDGSYGHKGYVSDSLASYLQGNKPAFYYACGPEIMLQGVVSLMEEAGIPGEVSLEERMGCGVGACLACVCKVKIKDGDGWTYKKVCLEGPVFPAGEVLFGE